MMRERDEACTPSVQVSFMASIDVLRGDLQNRPGVVEKTLCRASVMGQIGERERPLAQRSGKSILGRGVDQNIKRLRKRIMGSGY